MQIEKIVKSFKIFKKSRCISSLNVLLHKKWVHFSTIEKINVFSFTAYCHKSLSTETVTVATTKPFSYQIMSCSSAQYFLVFCKTTIYHQLSNKKLLCPYGFWGCTANRSSNTSFFFLAESSFIIPYRMMCEWRYQACASPCVHTCSDPDATRCQFLPQ